MPPQYNSLLAKVIVWGEDREAARARMKRALAECMIEGVATTIPFHRRLLDDPAFVRHQVSTAFVERWLAQNGNAAATGAAAVAPVAARA